MEILTMIERTMNPMHESNPADVAGPDNWRMRPLARAIVSLSCSFMLVSTSAPLFAQPAVNELPTGGVVVGGDPVAVIHSNVVNQLTIDQAAGKAIIDWQTFNIGSQAAVQFNQPTSASTALNRIHDASASAIFGKLNANGNIYLINNNGILFGNGAQVNTHGLVASTLNIDGNQFVNGTLGGAIANGQAAFEGGTAANAAVVVDNGAKITTDSGGQVLVFAPSVENRGDIETPDGQTLLAASKDRVYLVNSDADSDLRGLLVEVATGGDVKNVGNIVAERGNITLLGLAVNQEGRVRATTSVDLNGSVRLIARDGATARVKDTQGTQAFSNAQFLDSASEISASSGNYLPVASRTGTVTLGGNSTTEVVADNGGKTATDAAQQPQSRVQVMAQTIDVQAGAQVKVPAGRVDLVATGSLSAIPTVGNQNIGTGRVYLGAGSSIDVSGEDVQLDASRRTIEVELRGDELKDAPLQRDGVLRGEKVQVDIFEGSPLIADLTPWLGLVQKDARERMTAGGAVNLLSAGDVVIAQGANVDISGGSVSYADGLVNTSKLLSRGRIYDIGSADPNLYYDRILGATDVTHSKWGSQTYGGGSVFSIGTWRPGFTEGAAGGLLNIEAPTLYGFDLLALDAHVQQGQRQRLDGLVAAASRVAIDVAVGANASLVQNVAMAQLAASESLAVDAPLPFSGSGRPVLNISASSLNGSGVGEFSLVSNGDVQIAGDVNLQLAPGAKLAINAATIGVDGDLRLPGGSVTLATAQPATVTDPEAKFPLRIGAQATIDVSGLWTNELLAGSLGASQPVDPVALNGGSIRLTADGDLRIAEGARLRADAGARLSTAGRFSGGNGGSIALTTAAQVVSDSGSVLELPSGAISAYGFGKGGSLALTANSVAIGGSSADPLTLLLPENFFTQGGFAKYTLNANLHGGIRVADGAQVVLQQQNLALTNPAAASRIRSGDAIAQLAAPTTLAAEFRKPTDLSLNAVRGATGALGSAPVHVGTGSAILGEPGSRISISGDDSIFIDGTLFAPGGAIDIALTKSLQSENYRPDLAIRFGANAALLAPAAQELKQNAAGLLLADIYDAGSISVRADRGAIVAEPGSLFDVSGAAFAIDRANYVGARATGLQRTTVNAAAGSLDFAAAEALLVYGDLRGGAPGDGIDGSLSFQLDRSRRDLSAEVIGSYRFDNLYVDLLDTLPAWSDIGTGAAIPVNLRSRALVGADTVMAGGFGSLTLGASNVLRPVGVAGGTEVAGHGVIRAGSDIAAGTLALADTLTLDATVIDLAGYNVNLAARSVLFGQDISAVPETGKYQQAAAPVAGSGVLKVEADFIELLGNLSITHADNVTLASRGDIRLRSHIGLDDGEARVLAPARLRTAGDLHLAAAQIYPNTLSDYTIELTGSDSVFRTSSTGGARTPILSAGGTLSVLSPFIEHGGVLAAPLGQILLGNASTQRIDLLAGSDLDVSSEYLIPFGRLRGDIDWTYPLLGIAPLVISAPPEKRIELQGDAIDMHDGARMNVSGGGDITAFEFIAGPGGSVDFLAPANANGGFAVVPWLNSQVTPFDTLEMATAGIAAGQIIYLDGGSGLPAGNYAVLPAHYALLPGAYLVTPAAGSWNPGQTSATSAGTAIVAGRFGRAFSGQYDSTWQGFTIERGDVARTRSQYVEATGDAYFADKGVDRAIDAGRVVIDADTALQLNGVIASQSQQGRGAQLDIVADAIEIVESAVAGSGVIQLAAGALNALGVDSLLLGGRRTRNGDDTAIAVNADSVVIRDGAALSVPDLIVAARDTVQLEAGAQIAGTGASQVNTERFLIAGDGAFLRASTGAQADVVRTGFTGAAGDLVLADGSSISGVSSLLLDATHDVVVDGTLALADGSLNLTANRINLGAAPVTADGVVLTAAEIAALDARELRLSSRSSIDFYGDVAFANDAVQFNAGELRSMLGGDVAIGAANTLQLSNSGDVGAAGATTGSGALRLSAQRIELGSERDNDTTLSLAGFDRVEIGAATTTQEIIGQGLFALAIGGDAALTANRIGVASGASLAIRAEGSVETVRAGVSGAALAAAPLGGALSIAAARIDHGGAIELPSGAVELIANGANVNDDVTLRAGSSLSVAGRSIAAPEGWVSSDAGSLLLRSDNGSIAAEAASSVSVAGGEQGGNAGSLLLRAPNGDVNWSATTDVAVVDGARGGSLAIDKRQLGDADAWLALAATGFDQSVHLRARSGDVALNTALVAHDVDIAVDQGSLLLNAAIDASGSKGGKVALYAGSDLLLSGSARIDARAASFGGRGGRVELGTSGLLNGNGDAGRVQLAAGSAIDVAGGPRGGDISQGRDGRVLLRAPRTNANSDVGIDIDSGASITGAEAVVAEGVAVYSTTTLDNAFLGAALADADAFMANSAAIATRLGNGVSVRPGIEVRSAGDLTIAEEINFASVRYGADALNRIPGDPGVLTLRAAGDVIVNASLRDGLVAEADPYLTDANGDPVLDEFGNPIPLFGLNIFTGGIPNMLLMQGESWQYRVAAGAALDAANPLATRDDGAGDLLLQNGADIVTGAADISLAAAGDVIAAQVDTVIASLGLSAYRQQGAGPFGNPADSFIDLGGWLPDTGTIESWIIALNTGYLRLMYPEQGGDVGIRAGGDVRFAQAVDSAQQEHFFSDWILRFGGDDFALDTSGQVPSFEATTWGVFTGYFAYGDSWKQPGATPNAQGVAVLGGGDLRIDAGRDILNLNAALPTTGKQVGAVGANGAPIENIVEILGGGDMYLTAGRDIGSPRILADRGAVNLFAGADIAAATDSGLAALFVLGDTQVSATARGDIAIGGVLDSTTMPQSLLLNSGLGDQLTQESYFFGYTADARLSVVSTAGDISLNDEAAGLRNIFGSRFAASNVITRNFDNNGNLVFGGSDDLWQLLPASVSLRAISGDLDLLGNAVLFPSATGALNLFAGNDIVATASVRMSDVPLSELALVANPANAWFISDSETYRGEGGAGFDVGAAARLIGDTLPALSYAPLHTGDRGYNWITALNGDIDNLSVVLPRQSRIYAGRDLIQAKIDITHPDAFSISEIVTGRDISYVTPVRDNGSIAISSDQIRISGAGRLDVIAGRDINFGTSPGIESLGDSQSSNQALPDNGADVTVMAGVNAGTAATSDALYVAFANRYFTELDPVATNFIDWFVGGAFNGDMPALMESFTGQQYASQAEASTAFRSMLVSAFTGSSYATAADAMTAFQSLPVLTRQTIALEAYQQQKLAVQGSTSASGYAAAGGHRPAYSAELVDFVSSERFAGDLASAVGAITGVAYSNSRDAAAAMALLPVAQQHLIARNALDNASLLSRRELVLETGVAEVRKGGIEDARQFFESNSGLAGFERSDAALALLFPGDTWQGDIKLGFSALRSYDDGDINLFAPGGQVDVGLAGTVAGFTRGADKLGIVTSGYGAINVVADQSINVNASRIFSLDGAGITLWSSEGDIDAGKGAKTVASVEPPRFVLQEDGSISIVFPPSVTGSGIKTVSNALKTAIEQGALGNGVRVDRQRFFRSLGSGNAYLFAPQGVIDAGDAGISIGGNLLLAAQQVVGADNIDVGGISIGVPTTSSVAAGTLSLGDVASSATESATSAMNDAIRETAEALAESAAAFVTVDVIGVGN
jgi:filamentous hemagglutinin family protein